MLAIGQRALYENTTGEYNLALGNYSLTYNTEGSRNTAIGFESLYSNTTVMTIMQLVLHYATILQEVTT